MDLFSDKIRICHVVLEIVVFTVIYWSLNRKITKIRQDIDLLNKNMRNIQTYALKQDRKMNDFFKMSANLSAAKETSESMASMAGKGPVKPILKKKTPHSPKEVLNTINETNNAFLSSFLPLQMMFQTASPFHDSQSENENEPTSSIEIIEELSKEETTEEGEDDIDQEIENELKELE